MSLLLHGPCEHFFHAQLGKKSHCILLDFGTRNSLFKAQLSVKALPLTLELEDSEGKFPYYPECNYYTILAVPGLADE